MTSFYICRHGETENNRAGRLSGWIDTPLTPAGGQNAHAAAGKLKGKSIDLILSSDLGRAFVTAYIIARQLGHTEEIRRLPDLREVSYGELANVPIEDYPKLTPEENERYTPPGGESLLHMQARVLAQVRKLAAEHSGKTLLLAAHDGTINAIRSHIMQRSIGAEDAIHNPHDFVARFTCDENGLLAAFAEL